MLKKKIKHFFSEKYFAPNYMNLKMCVFWSLNKEKICIQLIVGSKILSVGITLMYASCGTTIAYFFFSQKQDKN